MKTTTLEAFQDELRSTGGYETPAERRAPTRRKPGAWPTFAFSVAVSRVYPYSAVYEALGKLTVPLWAQFCFSAVTMPERYGMSVHAEGWKNRERVKGPCVYVCNHLSTLETVLLPPILLTYGPLRVITKASLAHLPFLEKAAAHVGVVPVGRKDPRADLMAVYEAGQRYITQGESFLIFSQGTRRPVFDGKQFSSIGAKLAEKCGVPLVPVAVDTRCMPTRTGTGLLDRVFKDFGPLDTSRDVRCACGPAIPCGKSREMHAASVAWIAGQLKAWGMDVGEEKRD